MMKCKQYIFLLTSGQLRDAPAAVRLDAGLHRLLCRYCRTFTRNDARLDAILDARRGDLRRDDGPGAPG